ncbi:MAG: CRISPR-associated endonuclease Cas2 [Aureispira sp.]|nr:CRISPR-associated endonuclease Cas2 [Aureispira sp.]
MYLWIMYDISDNKHRKQVAKRCKLLGLHAVQKSVFCGFAPSPRLVRQFEQELPYLINLQKDRVFILPMPQSTKQQLKSFGQEALNVLETAPFVLFL